MSGKKNNYFCIKIYANYIQLNYCFLKSEVHAVLVQQIVNITLTEN